MRFVNVHMIRLNVTNALYAKAISPRKMKSNNLGRLMSVYNAFDLSMGTLLAAAFVVFCLGRNGENQNSEHQSSVVCS